MFSRYSVSEIACARPKIEKISRFTRAIALTTALSSAVTLTVPSTALAAPAEKNSPSGLKLEVDAKGIKSLRYNGIELAGPDTVLTRVNLRRADGTIAPASDSKIKSSFDVARSTLIVQYPWGKASYRYATESDNLLVTTTIQNQTSQTIVSAYNKPLVLRIKGGLQAPGRQGSSKNLDDVAIIRREFSAPDGSSGGSLFLVSEGIDTTYNLGIGAAYKSGNGLAYALQCIAVQQKASDNVNVDTADIQPGKSKSYTFSLRFGPQNRTFEDFSKPLYVEHGQKVDNLLKWNDRRPIGSIFAANSNTGYPGNPRGWFNDKDVDINSAQGRAKFQARMLKFADGCVKNLKNVGAQGMIFWDVEGEEMPHATTYLGDPRILPQATPEMDEIADQFFAKFRNAGLKTGITLRPSRVVIDPKTNKWRHNHMAFDVVNEISQKIDLAQKRWGSTIFYVDSNATYAYDSDGKVTSWVMRAEMFRELERRHPDCLIIPEHENFDYWSATAPYQELRSNSFGTPDMQRVAYPKAFSVINITDGDLNRHHDALVEDVKNGDVLLFRCWFNDNTHEPVKEIYREADATTEPEPEPELMPDPTPFPMPEPTPDLAIEPTPEVKPQNDLIIDNRDVGATYEGAWNQSKATKGFYDRDYRHDVNEEKGAKSVRFTPRLPQAGTWQVFARWTSYNNRATNALYDVIAAGATDQKPSATLLCNQQKNGGQWVSLGQYFFQAGSAGSVVLRNDDANGFVIADAVKWVFVASPTTAVSPAKTTNPATLVTPTSPSTPVKNTIPSAFFS